MNTSPEISGAGFQVSEELAPETSFPEFDKQLPDPFTILGLTLRPLSIGRYRRLARHKVAFVAQGKASASLGDLILGIVICSLRCDEFDALANQPAVLKRVIHDWFKKVSPLSWRARVPVLGKYWFIFAKNSRYEKRWREKHSFNFVEKMQLFQKYVEAAQEMPKFYAKNASNKTSQAHWVDNVECMLREKLGWKSEEVNEQPLSKALEDYLNWAQLNDLVELYDEEDMATAEHNTAIFKAGFEALATAEQPEGVPA